MSFESDVQNKVMTKLAMIEEDPSHILNVLSSGRGLGKAVLGRNWLSGAGSGLESIARLVGGGLSAIPGSMLGSTIGTTLGLAGAPLTMGVSLPIGAILGGLGGGLGAASLGSRLAGGLTGLPIGALKLLKRSIV